MRPRVTVAHPGTQYAMHLARELWRHRLLERYITGCVFQSGSSFTGIVRRIAGRTGHLRQLQNRIVEDVPRARISNRPLLEVLASASIKCGMRPHVAWRYRNEMFQWLLPKTVIESSDIVVGFDTASRILAKRIKGTGKKFILDQSIGHPRAYREVQDRLDRMYPEWTSPGDRKDDEDIESESQEHRLADLIVVPSRFVEETLVAYGVDASKIRVNPFGTNLALFHPSSGSSRGPEATTFLFLGTFTSRKGVPLLLEAWRKLGTSSASLILAGTGTIPDSVRRQLPASVEVVGPIMRSDLPSLFARATAFVFPSFFEGLAMVQVEAAACGLPIVGTRASGAEEIVLHERTGFVIPTGDALSLASCLERIIRAKDEVREMRRLASERASMWGWAAYGDRWAEQVVQLAQ